MVCSRKLSKMTEKHDYNRAIKINTGRYLYHIASHNREKIKTEGLTGRYNDRDISNCDRLVFAHNSPVASYDWYWLCLDFFMYSAYYGYYNYTDLLKNDMDTLRVIINNEHDIWRIDNHIAKKQWFVDSIGLNDNPVENLGLYAYCRGTIPPEAITLCTLDKSFVTDYKHYNGATVKYNYNPIIAREEYIKKYGHKPEEEFNMLRKQKDSLIHTIEDLYDFNTEKRKKIMHNKYAGII